MLFPPRKTFQIGKYLPGFSVSDEKKTPAKNYLVGPFMCACVCACWAYVCMCVCAHNKCGCVKLFRVKFPGVLRSEPHFIHSFMCVCRGSELHFGWKIFRIYLLIFIFPCVGVLIAQPMAALYHIHLNFHLMELELTYFLNICPDARFLTDQYTLHNFKDKIIEPPSRFTL